MQGIYVDGLRTPLLLHSPNETYVAHYDAEFTVLLSDWYHNEQPGLSTSFINIANPGGAEPIPGGFPHLPMDKCSFFLASACRFCPRLFLPKRFLPGTDRRDSPIPGHRRGGFQRERDPPVPAG
jgi:hypothetical protein